MYNYYPQNQYRTQMTSNTTQSLGLKGRPVSSEEEARAATIDFDGSIFFFPDLANKRIYTKQIRMDGTMSLNMYELKELPPVVEPNLNSFVTREEFTKAIEELQKNLAPTAVAAPIAETPARKDFELKF